MSSKLPAWFVRSFACLLPAVIACGLGGVLGPKTTMGAGLLGVGALWLVVDLLWLQPRLDRIRPFARETQAAVARRYLESALGAKNAAQIGNQLARVTKEALGAVQTYLLVPSTEHGGIQVVGLAQTPDFTDPEKAFALLAKQEGPVDLLAVQRTAESGDEGARAVANMISALGGQVVLPLKHRSVLLGLIVIASPSRQSLADYPVELLRALGVYTTVAIANAYLHLEAGGKRAISKEFDLATAVQEALMPDERPYRCGDVLLCGICKPVAACGGDLWLYQDLGHGKVLVVVADATGHGAAPAMLTAVLKGAADAMRHVAGAELDPAQLLEMANRAIYLAGRTEYMMSAFAVVVDSVAMKLHSANAGHNFPCLITPLPDGKAKISPIVVRGNTLGADAESKYTAATHELPANAKLVLYSDGIPEAGSPKKPFTEKRFRALLQKHALLPASRIPSQVIEEVKQYLGDTEPDDDMTLVALEILRSDDTGTGTSNSAVGRSRGGQDA